VKTRKHQKRLGKAIRQEVPFSSHAPWTAQDGRFDPIELLQAQDEGRVKRILPIKYGRMLESPFAFFRGSAVLMAADLAGTPDTGIHVSLCGDAHLSNFGLYASPERRLVFDINDFDEVYPGPWEWDLKRLATSAVVAGRNNGFSDNKCRKLAAIVGNSYSWAMGYFSNMTTMNLWYHHVRAKQLRSGLIMSAQLGKKSARKMIKKARRHTHGVTLEKLTIVEDKQLRILSDPPLLIPFGDARFREIVGDKESKKITKRSVEYAWTGYLDSLTDERRYLLRRFEIVDIAFRIGGIGSVGTRCLIVLIHGGAKDDYLLLQLKEARASALVQYLPPQNFESQAQRVVNGQRLMQAASDIFLGWHHGKLTAHDFYWRQLKDMKASANIAGLSMNGLKAYLAICAWCLARSHARTGDEVKINGYLGRKGTFNKAIADFALGYADQVEKDYQTLVTAVKSGKIPVEIGI
jgi:uncharacterized protein (DUF2252 family)